MIMFMNKMQKFISTSMLTIISFLTEALGKDVHAMIIYAPPEVMDRRADRAALISLIREYSLIAILVGAFTLIGIVTTIKFLIKKFSKKQI